MLPALYVPSLTAIGAASGIAILWVFERFSDQARLRLAKRQIRAHLYAIRLFADEPRLIFRAQKQLLLWNGRYLALMLRPAAVLIVPMLLLMAFLDAVYGHRPLEPNESAIVTAQFRDASDLKRLMPSLEGRNVIVETTALRIPDERQACWRVRAPGPAAGSVVLRVPGVSVSKAVRSGLFLSIVAERRVASPFSWPRYPGEPLLPDGPLRWVEVSYPPARVKVVGFQMHWLVWFTAVNLATVLALRKTLGVSF